MPDSLMYSEEMYVVLEADQAEQFVTPAELLVKLAEVLANQQEDLPADLQGIDAIADQAQHLLSTTCELDLGPNQFLQWYAVRLEK